MDDDTFLNELQSNNFVFFDEKIEKEKEKELKKQNSIIEKKIKQNSIVFNIFLSIVFSCVKGDRPTVSAKV